MSIRFNVLLIIWAMKGDSMNIDTIKTDITIPETIKTGSILEVKQTHAIVVSEGMEFVYVKKKEGMAVGQTIYYFEEDIYRLSRMNYKSLLVYAASLCFMFMVMYGATHLVRVGQQSSLSYGIVTMDINPSVEIHINEMGKVLKTVALNKDARSIIQDEYKGMDLEDVLDTLTQNAQEAGFLEEDGAVMLTYTVVDQEEEALEVELKDEEKDENHRRLETYMEKKRDHYKFLFAKGTEESIRAAKSQGLSVGKYTLLKYMNDDISLEALKEMPIKEIIELIDETDFDYNLKNNNVINKNKEGLQGPPEHSNASDQGRFSASEEKKWIQDQNKAEEKLESEKKDESNGASDDAQVTNNGNKDKEKPSTSNADQEKNNSRNKEKENKTDTDTDTDADADEDADVDIETNIEAEKKTINDNNSNSNKEKTNNGMDNLDNTTLEEVKDTEPDKEKEKDTTKLNSGKSETKSNPGNSKK